MTTKSTTPSPAILLKRKWQLVQCAAKLTPKRRARKPSIRDMIKEAEKARAKVTVAPDGTVSLQFGEAQTEPKSETDRELAEFEARHAKA